VGWSGQKRVTWFVAGAALVLGVFLSACSLTPHPLTVPEQAAISAADRQSMFADQPPLRGPLTLREAFRRALTYNLDARVKLMEEALAENDLDISRYDLLPKAYINANYSARSVANASSSKSILTNTTSVPPSVSSNIDDFAAQLNLSWNLLDFGVSYFNARQQANRVLVADEERRKVSDNLLQDVRRAFWRAAAAQELSGKIHEAIREAQNALPEARKVETEGLGSPVDSLRYQKALLDLIGQLEAAEHLLAVSKIELASLINLPPGEPYTLAVPPPASLHIQALPMPIRKMERTALIFNPDVREQSYQTRISVDETHKALLKLLPGLTFSANPNYDSNTYLVNNYWTTGSIQLAGYLNNLLLAPANIRRADESAELAARRREAVSMAVLAKLFIAYQQFQSDAAEYRRASELADVDHRLYQQIANRSATDIQGDLERVSAQVSDVFSTLRQYQNYAETQAALGRLYDALGLDPPPGRIELLDVATFDRVVQEALASDASSLAPVLPAADTVHADNAPDQRPAQPSHLFDLARLFGTSAPPETPAPDAPAPLGSGATASAAQQTAAGPVSPQQFVSAASTQSSGSGPH
jgi:outer membrane protein, multidrug efflux system